MKRLLVLAFLALALASCAHRQSLRVYVVNRSEQKLSMTIQQAGENGPSIPVSFTVAREKQMQEFKLPYNASSPETYETFSVVFTDDAKRTVSRKEVGLGDAIGAYSASSDDLLLEIEISVDENEIRVTYGAHLVMASTLGDGV